MPTQNNRDYLLIRAYQAGITNPKELAVFMGQMDVESGGFESMNEDFNYSGPRLLQVFPRRNGINTLEEATATVRGGPETVANAVYGGEWGRDRLGNTEPGDGWRFHGRGYVQLTGRDNYTRATRELGIDLVRNPEFAAERETAAGIALHYWNSRVVANGHQINVKQSTRDINGGDIHLPERMAAVSRWERALTPEIMAGLIRGEVLLPPAPGQRTSGNQTVVQIQQNLNELGFTDSRGQPLVVDGIRGGPGSRTNQAIEAFRTQTSLPAERFKESSPAELLVATEAALDAREPLRRLDRTIDELGERFTANTPGSTQDAARRLVNGVPDYLLRERETTPVPSLSPAALRTGDTASVRPPDTPVQSAGPVVLPPLPDTELQPGHRGAAVLTLQERLRLVGATDRDGQELQADSNYGSRTKDAVEQFQLWTGRETTGIADRDTLQALDAQARFMSRQREAGVAPGRHAADNLAPAPTAPDIAADVVPLQRIAMTSSARTNLPPLHDPQHPQHGLYAELKAVLPDYTSEQRLAQFTAVLHGSGIRQGDLRAIDINADRAMFIANREAGISVRLGQERPPSIEDSLQQMEHDRQGQQGPVRRMQAEQAQQAPAMQH